MKAKYPGTCVYCHQQIPAGTEIGGSPKNWAHRYCIETEMIKLGITYAGSPKKRDKPSSKTDRR